jgi:hypothetical protein
MSRLLAACNPILYLTTLVQQFLRCLSTLELKEAAHIPQIDGMDIRSKTPARERHADNVGAAAASLLHL